MVPSKHGRHTTASRGRSLATPLVAFVAVVALAGGGWALLGRGSGSAEAPTTPVPVARAEPLAGPAESTPDRGTRNTERPDLPPWLGDLTPAPVTTTAEPSATPSETERPDRPAPRPPGAPTTTAAPAPTTTTKAPTPPTGDSAYATEVTRLTNVERAKAGCGAVTTNAKLAAAALAHSADMVDRKYFDHTSPDGKGPGERAAAAGYTSWSGENIAAGYPTPAAVVEGWMNSPGHKANILNCQSKATGVGYDARGAMWTQMFGFA